MTLGSSTDNQNDNSIATEVASDVENKDLGSQNADSSAAQDANKPKDMESAVRQALNKTEEGQSSSSDGNKVSGEVADPNKVAAQNAQKPTDEDSDLTETEINLLRPKTRKSFERMRATIAELNAKVQEVEQYKPAAETLANIQGFCEKANLGRDDVNNMFAIAEAVRNDPERGLQMLIPVVNQLMEVVGAVLPADLQEKVEAGEISPQYAQELSRLRSRDVRTKGMQEYTAEQQRFTEHKNSVRQMAEATGKAVSDLERQWQASDPDYRVKSTMVSDRIELELRKRQEKGNPPKNAEEAVALAKEVKASVDAYFKQFFPKKSPVNTVLGVGTSTASTPAPKTMLEAVKQAVGQ